MQPRVLLAVTVLNLGALAGSVLLLSRAAQLEPEPRPVPAVSAAETKPGPQPLAATPAPDSEESLQFAALVAEVFNLRGEVEALRGELADARATTPADGRADSADSPSPALPEPEPTIAEQFMMADGSGDGLENIGAAFAGGDGAEMLSSNCVGNMCRVSYQVTADDPGQRLRAMSAMSRRIAESVEGDVNMVFAQEGGESVVYIKRVN